LNWDQLKTILWLRWRLTRNQWGRNKGIGAAVAAIVAVGVCLLGGTSFAVALVGGIYGLGAAKANLVWGIWLGLTLVFLFFWMVGLLSELQRSESIDLQRLLHLPVSLGQIFVINYLASHLAVSIVVAVPAMMGLALGLAISRGPSMLLLAPLALGMVFMISAWTYCLRGWLATLMTNPRKRRNVIMVTMGAFILMAQLPNLYFNVFHRFDNPSSEAKSAEVKSQREAREASHKETIDQLVSLQKFVPPFWLPLGAQALAEGNALPALYGTLGCVALGALGLRRAYRSTLRFYRGVSDGKVTAQIKPERTPAAALAPAPAQTGRRFLELRLPFVPEQAAALALATFRSMLRAPEVKMQWGTSFLVALIVGGSILFRSTAKIPEAAKPFVATGAVVFSVFMLVQFFSNHFGLDRDGFRAFILSPVERRLILLGKNLACLPVGLGFGVVLLALIAVRLHLSILTLLAGLLQLASVLLLAGLVGNVLSILVPYRIQAGSLKPTKMPGLAVLVLMACHMFFPLAMSPVFVPPLAEFLWRSAGWPTVVPVNLILSLALAAVLALAYWQTLGPLGRLLQRRETKILGVVTVEVE
jgi:ABC-2 type transport system permease protein